MRKRARLSDDDCIPGYRGTVSSVSDVEVRHGDTLEFATPNELCSATPKAAGVRRSARAQRR